MTRFLGNRIPQTLLLILTAFWFIAPVMPRGVLFELLNGLLAATSSGIAVVFFASAWRQLRKRPYYYSSAHILTLGIAILHFFIVTIFSWGWFYQWLDRPNWMEQHLFRAWLVYGLWLGCVLQYFATAQTDEDADHHERIAMKAWVRLALIVTAGLGITVVVLLFLGRIT